MNKEQTNRKKNEHRITVTVIAHGNDKFSTQTEYPGATSMHYCEDVMKMVGVISCDLINASKELRRRTSNV